MAVAARDGRVAFAAACEAAHAEGRAASTGHAYAERRRRIELPASERDAIVSAHAGDVVGPLPHALGADVLHVLAVTAAEAADDATRAVVRRSLFAAWLAQARGAASIEWFWGPAIS